ncbi:hypothetical protein KKD62_02545 [Patescibacteria group bacterium]|nr:hypothetical protein [Patescibacteria group bacterium]
MGDFKEEDLYLSVDKNILKSDYPESIMVTERNYRRTDDYYWWPTREPVYLSLPTKTDEVAQWVTLAWNEKRPIVPQPARLVGLGLLDEYPKELVFADGSVTDPAQIKKFFLQQEDLADRVVNDQGEVVLEETLLSSWVSSVRLDNGKYMEKDGCVYDIAEELDWASPVATSEYLTDGSLRVLLWDNDYWVEYVDSVETGRLFDKNNVPLRIVLEKSGEASTILTSLAFLTSEDSHSPILTEGQGSVFVNPAEVSRWLEFRAMLEGANPAGTLDRLEKGLFRATDERSYFTEYISFDDHDYVRIGRFVRNSEYVLILTFLPTAEDGAVEHVEYPLCVQMYDKNGRSIGRLDHWGNVYH